MMTADQTVNENSRLEILKLYNILDTPPERQYDEITNLASWICGVPIAAIAIAETHRQWFKSILGSPLHETSYDASFHAQITAQNGVVIVSDTTQDTRFQNNPWTEAIPEIRFYAGAPLITPEGTVLGTLWVLDIASRILAPRQREALEMLGRQVMTSLELRRRTAEVAASEARGARQAQQASAQAKKLQEQSLELARTRDKALASSRIKAEFVANISHEIRTPINAIIGMTSMLIDTPMTPEQSDYTQTIESSSEELLALVNSVLDFSSIDSDQIHLEEEPFHLQDILQDVTLIFAPKAREKSLEFSCAAAPATPLYLNGSPRRLRQILVNLVSNAVKFTERGEITVGTSSIYETASQVRLRITVTDTGIGVDPQRQTAIFDDFTQGDGARTRAHGGAGLGLTVAQRLAKLMGGSIYVQSEPGVGSVFTAEVMLQKQEAERAPVKPSAQTAPGAAPALPISLRILLVEDNNVNQKVAQCLLARLGYKPEIVDDGRQAVSAVAGGDYDVVLMDVQMPNLDGYAATREIRRLEQETGRRIPIIALTANSLDGDRERCLASGMDDYIAKPIRRAELHRALARITPQAA